MKRFTQTLKHLVLSIMALGLLIACRLTGVPERVAPAPSAIPPAMSRPTPTTWEGASYQILTDINPTDGALLVFVPEGTFTMGSDEDARQVYLDAYWLYQTPVTNDQFAIFVEQTGYQTTAEAESWGWAFTGTDYERVNNAYWGQPEGPGSKIDDRMDHPVVHMSWFDAFEYCEWAGGSLPSEAQWEKAARGVDGRRFPWGDDPVTSDKANYCDINCYAVPQPHYEDASQDDGFAFTSPAGHYPAGASPYGALDMVGNVWEWVSDWWDPIYIKHAPDTNPTGPDTGQYRVMRGGYYGLNEVDLPDLYANAEKPQFHFYHWGFRCVVDPESIE